MCLPETETKRRAFMKYTPVPLCSYVNLWDPYCANAIQKETEYLKQLEPERLLHSFYVQAGLTPSAPALLHNTSTLGVSLKSMTNLLSH